VPQSLRPYMCWHFEYLIECRKCQALIERGHSVHSLAEIVLEPSRPADPPMPTAPESKSQSVATQAEKIPQTGSETAVKETYDLPCGCRGEKAPKMPYEEILIGSLLCAFMFCLIAVWNTQTEQVRVAPSWMGTWIYSVWHLQQVDWPAILAYGMCVFNVAFWVGLSPFYLERLNRWFGLVRARFYRRRGFTDWAVQLETQFSFRQCFTCAVNRLSRLYKVPAEVLAITQKKMLMVPRTVEGLRSVKYALMAELKSHCKGATEVQLMDLYLRATEAIGVHAPGETAQVAVYAQSAWQATTSKINDFARAGIVGSYVLPTK